ncbi:Transcriptional regulator uhpA [Modestobacter italicus]|uniref:Transcriptional regulator uhpA n=1 Tax=Modestobacter italicus (strain DSM 44449 / CECT 9708 / BC 501) TaxID=2732864 RepID=I4ERB2_MODI5|nr:response regulator transcription factor [Modestobacter marinus]CCH85925.1 Transcriptional regulator uhpA [Modestobacter marinus]
MVGGGTAPARGPVVVAGSSPLVRSSIREALAQEHEVLVAEDEAALRSMYGKHPSVLVTGVQVGRTPLLDLLPAALRTGARVLVVADSPALAELPSLLLHGASGALSLMASTEEDLRTAVRDVADGHASLHPAVARLVLLQWRELRTPAVPVLTTREREVLLALTGGVQVKTVARDLGLSAKTVESHRSRLFAKLGAQNKAQAVARALELGLLEPPTAPAATTREH